MDLLSLMNQRASDQHSEVRRSRLTCLAYTCAALAASVLASLKAPCIDVDSAESPNTSNAAVFLAASFAVLVCMTRAASALMASRYLPLPSGFATGGGFRSAVSSLLVLPSHEQISVQTRRTLWFSFYVALLASVCLGLSHFPCMMYIFALCVQWLVFVAYLVVLLRSMSTPR